MLALALETLQPGWSVSNSPPRSSPLWPSCSTASYFSTLHLLLFPPSPTPALYSQPTILCSAEETKLTREVPHTPTSNYQPPALNPQFAWLGPGPRFLPAAWMNCPPSSLYLHCAPQPIPPPTKRDSWTPASSGSFLSSHFLFCVLGISTVSS